MNRAGTLSDYRLGFIGVERGNVPRRVEHWLRINVGFLDVWVHPDCDYLKITDDEFGEALVLGDIFVAHGDDSLESNLAATLSGDYDSLDNLAGTFVLFIATTDSIKCITDPMGTKPLFYSNLGQTAVASHSSLLAEQLSIQRDPEVVKFLSSPNFRRRTTTYLPGDLTPFKGIYHLIPNNELQLPEVRTRRIWPRKSLEEATFENYIDCWTEYFSKYAKFLRGRYHPIVGLTPGVDSRALIASLRHNDVEPDYVTWDPIRETERVKVPKLVEYLSPIRHIWLPKEEKGTDKAADEMRMQASLATGGLKRWSTLGSRLGKVSDKRSVFIKGLGGEILRGSASKKLRPFLPDDPEKLLVRTYAGPPRSLLDGDTYLAFVRSAAEGFCLRANFSEESTLGYDMGDILYWEGRMGTYGSIGLLELSVGLNTHAAMNSRKLFETAWGLPDSIRLSKELLLRTAAQFDGEFSKFET